MTFTEQGLIDYIQGNFEQVDDIEGAEEIPAFLFSVLRQLFPELKEVSDGEMESDCIVEDALITASQETLDKIENLAHMKWLLI